MATNFFQRWSQRKLHIKDEADVQLEPIEQDAKAELSVTDNGVDDAGTQAVQDHDIDPSLSAHVNGEQAPAVTEIAEPQLTGADLTLPDLTLADAAKVTFDSGVSTFMKKGVEKSVKKAALRKLFHSDEFNYVSDMDDHTEDFSNIPVLDTKVTQQLRQWVNKVAETAEDMIDATGSEHSVVSADGEVKIEAAEGKETEEEAKAAGDIQEGDIQEGIETNLALTIPTELDTQTELLKNDNKRIGTKRE